MSLPPPVNHSGRTPSSTEPLQTPALTSHDTAETREVDEAIQQTALERLPPAVEAPKSGWGVFSWLSWGKKNEAPAAEAESVRRQEDSRSALEEDLSESLTEDTDSDIDDSASTDVWYDAPDAVEGDLKLEAPAPSPASEAPLEETVIKTYQAAQKTYWQRFKGWGLNTAVWAATPVIKKYAQTFDNFNKSLVVAEQKREMLNQLQDPQFVEFYEVVSHLLLPLVKENVLISLAEKQDSISQTVASQQSLVLKLLEVILARGFANLAQQVKENQAHIPDYDQQPSLLNVISLLCQKAGAHVDQQRLADIEKKYRKNQIELLDKTQKLFPGIERRPEEKESLQKYIQEYVKSTDQTRKKAIKQALIPNIDRVSGQRAQEVVDFFAALDALHAKNQELNQLFNQVTDDILLYLFPNKLDDIKEIEGWGSYLFGNIAYNAIKSQVADLLQEVYEPLENNVVRNQAWSSDLQQRLGTPDLQPVVEAPAALLVAFTKNYIQADPRVMDLTAGALESVVNPSAVKDQAKQQQLLNQLSQEQLANWIVESIQAMLHTQDPNLSGLGQFVKQALNNLTLALMAKGAQLVIPEGEQVEPHAFVKEFTERLVGKFSSLKSGETIPDQFWKEFVADLPLPSQVKDLLVPKLIAQAKSLQEELKKKNPDFQEIQRVHAEAEKKILAYEGGKELLSITEKVSDQIIEQVLEQNIGLVATLGLGDTIEELFAQYLPGVQINEDLKDWFKANVSALGVTEEGQSPESIILLKQGIQAVLRKALVNTIEKNFQSNGKDYAAQLLKNFQQAFSKAFTGFNTDQRKDVEAALNTQNQIEAKNKRINEVKEKIAKKPQGINSKQKSLLEEAINANTRYIRALNYVRSLSEKRDEVLAKLNETYEGGGWTTEDLSLVNEALVLRKIEAPIYPNVQAHIAALEADIKKYSEIASKGKPLTADQEQDLDQRQTLMALLEMSPNELKLLAEAVNTDVTLQHAEKEFAHLKKELEAKEAAIDQFDLGTSHNAKEWTAAQDWMKQVLQGKQEINQLSGDIAALEKELDTHLGVFQVLSEELTGLLGLDQKENLELPAFLQDNVWPLIQSAKKQQIARLLFTQVAPLLVSMKDVQENKDKLNQLSKGNPFLVNIVHAISEEVVSRIPEFVASYKPFAQQILTIMGVGKPDEKEVARMEVALQHTLIALGKEGTTASMLKPLVKGFVPEAREEALSQAIVALIAQSGEEEVSQAELLELLKKEVPTTNKKEERKLDKQAQVLTKSVNAFLFNRGKASLKPQDLLDAYQGQVEGAQKQIPADGIDKVLHDLESEKIVEKVKTVVITPEEIAQVLNDIIPGATDLHALIAPQLQNVLIGADPAFQANREMLQQFIEGTVLRLFVKIAEKNQTKNQNQDVLTVITEKLKDLALNAKPDKGQTAEEAARQLIDKVLASVLGITSEQDLDSIPLALRKVAYEKIHEQAYQQLTPLILPIVERNKNRAELEEKSGSHFLGHLCEALSKDVFALLPLGFKSYQGIAKDVFVLFANGQQPTSTQIEQFAAEIARLTQTKNVKNHLLIEAYAKVANKTLDAAEQSDLHAKLKGRKAKEEIKNIVITPEEIVSAISELMPRLDRNLQQALGKQIQGFIHESPDVYQNGSDFARTYIEGILLKVFIGVADKNPKQPNKDTLIVLTEKLLDAATQKYQEVKEGKKAEEVAQELNDSIMKEMLGIDSPQAFEGLPDALKTTAYNVIKNQVGGLLLRTLTSLTTVESGSTQIEQAKADSVKFGIGKKASKSHLQFLIEDIASMVMTSVPHVLAQISGENIKGVTTISKSIESYLEELSRGNMEMAQVLLNYTQGAQFQQMLGDNLTKIAAQDQFASDKQKAADLLGNLLIVPLGQVIEKAIYFEDEHKKQFNQNLMANFLHVAADHLKNLNRAKALAAQAGEKQIRHQDFVEAAGLKLHPGVPTAPVTYQQSIEFIGEAIYGTVSPEQEKLWLEEQKSLRKLIAGMIKSEGQGAKIVNLDDFIKEFDTIHLELTGNPLNVHQCQALKAANANGLNLRDLMRQEAEAPNVQRQEAAYAPAIKTLMKLMFPGGKNDLTFVSEELRGPVWKIFKKNLFPVVLPMLTEVILDPATINTIVLSSLESARESLEGKIVLETPEPAHLPLDALDQAAGELIAETLKATTLPAWMKKLIIDPKTGEISPAMKKTLGATFRKQFNDTFIKDKLQMALEKAVQRDANGKPILSFDTRSKEIKDAEAIKKAKKMQADLRKASRDVVSVSISYFIRSKWVVAQARFDALVANAFGKIGTKLKRALDAVFRFVFFTVVGEILSVLLWPAKQLVKEMIYRLISLDQNRDALLAMFTQAPKDQPDVPYAVYNEDLIFKMGEVLNQTVQQFLEEEPLLPSSATDLAHSIAAE